MPRQSIFTEPGELKDKTDKTLWVRGILTTTGMARFEAARKRLDQLYRRIFGHVASEQGMSDADTVEYLARGERASEQYLRKRKTQG